MKTLFLVSTLIFLNCFNTFPQFISKLKPINIAPCYVDSCPFLKMPSGNSSNDCVHTKERCRLQNLNWSSKYTLGDLYDNKFIFPKKVKGKEVYKIYYCTEFDRTPRKGKFTSEELEKMKVYKFKKRSHAKLFLKGNVCLTK